jgi:hypothetical protein
MKIFTANPSASKLNTTYLDAFAGTSFRTSPVAADRAEGSLFEDALEDPDTDALKKGSAYVALRTDPPFGRYIFVDRKEPHARRKARRIAQGVPQVGQPDLGASGRRQHLLTAMVPGD